MFSETERAFAENVVAIAYENPFLGDTIRRLEQQASVAATHSTQVSEQTPLRTVAERPQLAALLQTAEGLVTKVCSLIESGSTLPKADVRLYEDLVLFLIYFQYRDRLQQTLEASLGTSLTATNKSMEGDARISEVEYYPEFESDLTRLLGPIWNRGLKPISAGHLFACFFQVRRAFHLIFANIFGNSKPIQRLRADVWYSIFTHDLRRYRESLFDRMNDITTLVTGPSGTGKDLVAEAIGLSRYVAFRSKNNRFEENVTGAFHAVNLAALSPQIIESELFGHAKGSFTSAVKERDGWFDICQPSHTIFLDEIGELDPTIQVKLLRVLQNRTFQRLGETNSRRFEGKIIAATNRDLHVELREGRFRDDLFYRVCSDRIQTPSLKDQLADDPQELSKIVRFLAQRICGDAAEEVTKDAITWIEEKLPSDYEWPGNMRELEQCVRNILVRKEYHPLQDMPSDPAIILADRMQSLQVTAEELVSRYCKLAYDKTDSYVAAAKKLGLDRRTVKQKIEDGSF